MEIGKETLAQYDRYVKIVTLKISLHYKVSNT